MALSKHVEEEEAKRTACTWRVKRYLETVEALKKPNTLRKYRAVLERFSEFFTLQTTPQSITADDLNQFMVHLKKKVQTRQQYGHPQHDYRGAVLKEEWPAGSHAASICPRRSRRFRRNIATTSGISVNGSRIRNTVAKSRDTSGRPLSSWPFGLYQVAPETVWVASSYNPRRFDSRYFRPDSHL